jgi:DNA polymerase-3 subunit delta
MTKIKPTVYLIYGEDEFAIAEYVAEFVERMGDSSNAQLNISRIDSRQISWNELTTNLSTLPFLADRRLVILTNPLDWGDYRDKFMELLDQIPPTTALVLVHHGVLTKEEDRKKGKLNWLEKWVKNAGERAFERYFSSLKGEALKQWVQNRARESGGRFTPGAAERLVALLGDDPRLIDQEIQKLLVYVNFSRDVEVDDVENLTALVREGNIFDMVDAIAERRGQQALGILRQLLSEQEPIMIWGMIIRQFRLLLLAREVVEGGGNVDEVIRQLKVHEYVAKKVTPQSRRFSLSALEGIYHRLLLVDEAMKSGDMDEESALETLVAELML